MDIVVSEGPKTVTYTGTVSGSISTNDESFIQSDEGVTVTVYIADSEGYHQVASAQVGPTEKASISLAGSVSQLVSSDGSISLEVTSSSGADVTDLYSNSLTLTFKPE